MNPEGPVFLADGSLLVVEGTRGTVTQIMRGGRSTRIIATTGEPNGLAVDGHGVAWIADVRPPALIRLTMDGRFDRVLTDYHGEPFKCPNDLCFGRDGKLYLTDSGFFTDDLAPGGVIPPDWKTLKMDGRLYRIDPDTLASEMLDDDLYLANGLGFGPDGDLYVAETVGGRIYRYALRNGRPGKRQEFGNLLIEQNADDLHGPDGFAFDVNGKRRRRRHHSCRGSGRSMPAAYRSGHCGSSWRHRSSGRQVAGGGRRISWTDPRQSRRVPLSFFASLFDFWPLLKEFLAASGER